MHQKISLFSTETTNKNNTMKASDQLLNIFEDIHNHIYANDGLSSQQAFFEVLKILFIKIFDEKNNLSNKFYITTSELKKINNGENALSFQKRINLLNEYTSKKFSEILEYERFKLKLTTLAYIVEKLQNINISDSSEDVKGLAFQKFVYSKQRRERGQFLTPEPVIDLCIQIIKPTKDDKVMDPACGSARFLSQTMKYVFQNSLKDSSKRIKENYVKNNLYGIEINPMIAKIAKIRMILEGGGDSNIAIFDSLSKWDTINFELNKISSNVLNTYENFFDVVLTNPPFGSQGKVTNKKILRNFNLGYKWSKDRGNYYISKKLRKGQIPDILFIERCLNFLKYGGRMAIVIPNGVLENPSLEYVRNYIEKNAKIIAIIDLPAETFIPFGSGIKTSIIFLQKLKSSELEKIKSMNYKIYFGKIKKIGYSGNKNGSAIYKTNKYGIRLTDRNGNNIIDEDISDLLESYNNFISKKDTFKCNNKHFSINYNELTNRFDFNFHKPFYIKLEKRLKENSSKELGQVIKIIKRKAQVLSYKNKITDYVELTDINPNNFEIINSTKMYVHELPVRAKFELKEGDIITAVAGNSIGTDKHVSAIVTSEFDSCVCTNGLRILQPNKEIDPYYLLFYLKSELFLKQIYRYRTGSTIPSISDRNLSKILIYVPPKEKQRIIGNKIRDILELGKKTKKILRDTKIDIENKIIHK